MFEGIKAGHQSFADIREKIGYINNPNKLDRIAIGMGSAATLGTFLGLAALPLGVELIGQSFYNVLERGNLELVHGAAEMASGTLLATAGAAALAASAEAAVVAIKAVNQRRHPSIDQ